MRQLALRLTCLTLVESVLVAIASAQHTATIAETSRRVGFAASEVARQDAADRPDLVVGDLAPPIEIERWLTGDAGAGDGTGDVTVVDFWTVWCAPCIAAMPELSSLQRKYRNRGLRVLSIAPRPDKWGHDLASIRELIEQRRSIIDYAIGLDAPSENESGYQGVFFGKTIEAYMGGAEIGAIPIAFVIDRDGHIAAIGDPQSVEETIVACLDQTHDLDRATKAYTDLLDARKRFELFKGHVEAGRHEQAVALGRELTGTVLWNDARYLVSMAETLLASVTHVDCSDLAVRAAARADELRNQSDPGTTSIHARACYANGDVREGDRLAAISVDLAVGDLRRIIAEELADARASNGTIAPGSARNWSEQAMREDAQLLLEHLRGTHPQFARFMADSEWDAAFHALYKRLDDMEPSRYFVELSSLVSNLRDGHTGVAPSMTLFPALRDRWFPLIFMQFADGVYITAAGPECADLAGVRVVTAGGEDVASIIERAASTIPADNPQVAQSELVSAMSFWTTWQLMDLVTGDGSIVMDVEDPGGSTRTITLKRPPAGRPRPVVTAGPNWACAERGDGLSETLVRRVREEGRPYSFEWLEDQHVVYFQFNEVSDDPEEPITSFAERLFDFIGQHSVERLVIDLRTNGGGDNYLVQPLIHRVLCSSVNQPGRLFVLTGPQTFSAAVAFAARLECQTHAIFVGEPTGAGPNHCGDARSFTLSNTGITARISTLYWQESDPRDCRKWIGPDLPVPVTYQQWVNGEDPALRAALDFSVGEPDGVVLPEIAVRNWLRASQDAASEFGRSLLAR